MRVLVCGGRDYGNLDRVFQTLNELHEQKRITAIIEGGARGADELARTWAKTVGVKCETYRADWTKHGKAAGPIRNERMARESQADLCIAFPGGRGTLNMIATARSYGISVREIS